MNDKKRDQDQTIALSAAQTAYSNAFEPPPFQDWDRYQVISLIGEGAIGRVYKAFDPRLKRYVALKFLNQENWKVLERFSREARSQAQIMHENICKIFEVGDVAGRRFIAMQHIEGRTLEEMLEAELSIEQKVRILQQVSEAVHAAHRLGIIHRDLKPSNIMIEITEDGIFHPYVLDFGLARELAEAEMTVTGTVLGTPYYMSPEQALGKVHSVDKRSDVYSLGATLYHLLAGHPPFEDTTGAIFVKLAVEEPRQLRHWNASIPQDLEAVVMKCLEKDPARRYESARELANELQRYLDGEAVEARKGFWSYRAEKFVRRHRGALVAVAAIFILMIAFSIITAVQNVRIAKERDTAQSERDKADAERLKAETVTAFLVQLFEENDPVQAKGANLTAREILDRGAKRIRTEMKGQPDVQAKLLETVGNLYVQLGLYDQATPLLEDALKIQTRLHGKESAAAAECLRNLGAVLRHKGQLDEAERMYRDALAIRRKLQASENLPVAESLNDLASVLQDQGHLEESEKLFREALDVRRKLLGNENGAVAETLNDLASVLQDRGKLDQSEALYRQAIAMEQKLGGKEDPDAATGLNNLALVLQDKGKLDEAEALLRQALAIQRKLYGNEHPAVAVDLNNLARVARDKGRLDEAENLYREALAINRKALGDEHPNVAMDLYNLGMALQDKGELPQAESLLRESLAIDRKLLGNEHPYIASDLDSLADVLRDEQRLPEAESLYRQALALRRKTLGNDHPKVAGTLAGLAETLIARGDRQGAVPLLNEALAIPLEKMPQDDKFRAAAKSALGACCLSEKKYEQAEALLLDAYRVLSAQETGSQRTKRTLQRILALYDAWKKPEKADAFRRAAAGAKS